VAFDKPVFFKDLIGLIASAVLAPGAQPRTLEVRACHDLSFVCLFVCFLFVRSFLFVCLFVYMSGTIKTLYAHALL
jgi:hypothetical protein